MSLHTAAMAKRRGLDVEVIEIEGDHGTHVPRAMMQSILFFQTISAQEIAPWNGETTPLPGTAELDLGDGVKLKFARVEPGKFLMGSPPSEEGRGENELRREMEITKPYGLGVYEVTQAQYLQVMGMKPSGFSIKGDSRERVYGLNTDDFPVENVSWDDAMDFCRIVSLLPSVRDKGWVVDLPTDAEWEYAARAGTADAFHYGVSLSSEQANFNGNNPYGGAAKGSFLGRPTKVGNYAPNAWGFYDMHGNIAEWLKENPVVRGGAWGSSASDCRAARRRIEKRIRSDIGIGFRVVVRLREK
jgi:formylglycine-generating enzyme required for sulfatase activity